MVFESLVVDLINKYLGDFVENLDKSQLKLGIWGGLYAKSMGGVSAILAILQESEAKIYLSVIDYP